MLNFGDITNGNNAKHNLKWPFIPDHQNRILITGGSGSGKTNVLPNSIKEKGNDELTDKMYLYAKDLREPKYQLLIKKREDAGIKHLNDPKAFTEYSNTMNNVSKNIDNYNPKRNRKNLIVFDDMIADININKTIKPFSKNYLLDARN